jgi:mRNA interferase RelE/StbE
MSPEQFTIAWTAPARRALVRMPEKVAAAVVEFLYGSLAANPHRVGKPLRLGLEGMHSARRGDYRVIYRINETAHRVEVLAIEHRADVYRPTRAPRPRRP